MGAVIGRETYLYFGRQQVLTTRPQVRPLILALGPFIAGVMLSFHMLSRLLALAVRRSRGSRSHCWDSGCGTCRARHCVWSYGAIRNSELRAADGEFPDQEKHGAGAPMIKGGIR